MQFTIVADENMPNVEPWFSPYATTIRRVPGRTLTNTALVDTDVLLVRSITQVNQSLLENTAVKFVGSATIGTDHIDQDYLASQNIPFHHAPGCNAQSVVDWLLSVLARLHLEFDLDWTQKVIGVVGVGYVGSKVVDRLAQFGVTVLCCDPIKHQLGKLDQHIELNTLLAASDIVCLHTPHTTEGEHVTHKLMNAERFDCLKKGSWLINAGRGPVIDESALLQAIEHKSVNVVLDVWPNEPMVSSELLNAVYLASPHVAGYSLEGKYKGTEMLAHAFAKTFNLSLLETVALPQGMTLDARLFEKDDLSLWASEIVLAVYDPARDTATMRFSVENETLSADLFDALRKDYPKRRELASTTVLNAPEDLKEWLQTYGFRF